MSLTTGTTADTKAITITHMEPDGTLVVDSWSWDSTSGSAAVATTSTKQPKVMAAQEQLDEWMDDLGIKTLAAMVMLLPSDSPLMRMARYKLRKLNAQEDTGVGTTGKSP